jgi:hypothetical protein
MYIYHHPLIRFPGLRHRPADLEAALVEGGEVLEDGGRDVDGVGAAGGALVDDPGGRVLAADRDGDGLAAQVGLRGELRRRQGRDLVRLRVGLAARAQARRVVGDVSVESEDVAQRARQADYDLGEGQHCFLLLFGLDCLTAWYMRVLVLLLVRLLLMREIRE